MDYEPLHHKYRPQTFAALVGQQAIATTLTHALQQNRIAPAYLFSGPRGTGKTSSARILAKSLNCLSSDGPTPDPCGHCQVCREITSGIALDVVEIDAASNTGVDHIRELIERAQFAPVQCRHKVYVIDECHMLSTAAFNALLKTLEEPPSHVVFVLATTDPQRVLPTIISRCQRFDFRRIPLADMVRHLGDIAEQENIALTPAALQLVAQISQGGLRDAESLLDQLGLLPGEVTAEAVWELVGAVPERDLLALVQAIFADDGPALLEQTRSLLDRGREPLIVLQGLVAFYRDLLIAKTAGDRADLAAITPQTWAEMVSFAATLPLSALLAGQQHLRAAELQVKNTTQPRLWLEIALLGLLPSAHTQGATQAAVGARAAASSGRRHDALLTAPRTATPTATPTPPAAAPTAPPTPPPTALTPPPTAPSVSPTAPPTVPPPAQPAVGSMADIWQQLLTAIEPRATQMLMTQQGKLLALDGVTARIGFKSQRLFKLAQARVTNLEAAFEQVFGYAIKVSLEVVADPDEAAGDRAAASDSPALPAQPPAPVSEPPLPSSATQPLSADQPLDPTLDELDRSAKSLAQFFNGQIVELDDPKNSPQSRHRLDSPASRTEPGSDVPF